jgi:hypothetical protein
MIARPSSIEMADSACKIATRPNAVALEVRLLAMDQMLMDVMRIVGFKGDFPCRPAATKVFKQMAAR